jgi:hypothetical protein
MDNFSFALGNPFRKVAPVAWPAERIKMGLTKA